VTGSVLPSATGACGTASVMVGAGLRLLSAGSPTVSQSPSSPWSTGSKGGISCKQRNFVVSIHNIEKQVLDYPTQGAYLLRRGLGSFSFLATHLRAMLRGLLGGTGKLASKVVGGSWMSGTLGSSGRLNLDRSWKPLLKRFLVIFI
jgi:hypothetical protein